MIPGNEHEILYTTYNLSKVKVVGINLLNTDKICMLKLVITDDRSQRLK